MILFSELACLCHFNSILTGGSLTRFNDGKIIFKYDAFSCFTFPFYFVGSFLALAS